MKHIYLYILAVVVLIAIVIFFRPEYMLSSEKTENSRLLSVTSDGELVLSDNTLHQIDNDINERMNTLTTRMGDIESKLAEAEDRREKGDEQNKELIDKITNGTVTFDYIRSLL